MPKWQQTCRISKREMLNHRGKDGLEEFVESRKVMLKQSMLEYLLEVVQDDQPYTFKYTLQTHDDNDNRMLNLIGTLELEPVATMKGFVQEIFKDPLSCIGPTFGPKLNHKAPVATHQPSTPTEQWSNVRYINLEDEEPAK